MTMLVLDTESAGDQSSLDPLLRNGAARAFALSYAVWDPGVSFDRHFARIGTAEWKPALAFVKRMVADKTISKLFHNAKHDVKILHFAGIDYKSWKGPLHDTMIMSYLLDENNSHNLKDLADRYLQDGGASTAPARKLTEQLSKLGPKNKHRYDLVDPHVLEAYSLADIDMPAKLYAHMHTQIERTFAEPYDVEMKLLPLLVDMEMVGIRIDKERLAVAWKLAEQRRTELSVQLEKRVRNPNSPKQVSAYVWDNADMSSAAKLIEAGLRSGQLDAERTLFCRLF